MDEKINRYVVSQIMNSFGKTGEFINQPVLCLRSVWNDNKGF